MTGWAHRAKGLALAAAVAALVGLVVVRNPGALGLGAFGLVVFGVLAMLGGLAWLFVTGAGS